MLGSRADLIKYVAMVCLALLASSAPSLAQSNAYNGTQDLRPTFMGQAFDIEGGEFDGKRGYLFRIWNRTSSPVSLATIPDRFNQPVLGFLSVGAVYPNGTASFEGHASGNRRLFQSGPELLNQSPGGTLADRPANFIVVVEPSVTQIVFTLKGRTATAALSNAEVSTLNLDPVPSAGLRVTAIAPVASNSSGASYRITVRNDTNLAVGDLVVMAYPATSTTTVKRGKVTVGALAPGAERTSQETFFASGSSGPPLGLTDFVFAFDDQSSLMGLDLDANGVRDDLDVLIDNVLSDDPDVRFFLRGMAKQDRDRLQATTSAQAGVIQGLYEDYMSCVQDTLFPDSFGNSDAIDRLALTSDNTEARLRASYAAWDLMLQERISSELPPPEERAAFCASALAAD